MQNEETLYDTAKASNARLKKRVKDCKKVCNTKLKEIRRKAFFECFNYYVYIAIGLIAINAGLFETKMMEEVLPKNFIVTMNILLSLVGTTFIFTGTMASLKYLLKKERLEEIKELKQERKKIEEIFSSQMFTKEQLESYKKCDTQYILKKKIDN